MAVHSTWVLTIPNTPEGRIALDVIKKGLHPNWGIRTRRRPTQDFGDRNKKKAVTHRVVYLYPRKETVTFTQVCSNCGGQFERWTYEKNWTNIATCRRCHRGTERVHEERKLNYQRFITIPVRALEEAQQ